MNFFKNINFLVLIATIALLSSCAKDDDTTPTVPNEEEIITTLNLTLVPTAGGDNILLQFKDLDGDGGNDPVITTAPLAKNTSYNATLSLLNESETPAEDITTEVQEEAEEHQFFFQGQGITDLEYLDQDGDGNPIGLSVRMSTTDVTQGQLTITLRHEPAKSATGVKDGDITNAGGETDIEVTFDFAIQ